MGNIELSKKENEWTIEALGQYFKGYSFSQAMYSFFKNYEEDPAYPKKYVEYILIEKLVSGEIKED